MKKLCVLSFFLCLFLAACSEELQHFPEEQISVQSHVNEFPPLYMLTSLPSTENLDDLLAFYLGNPPYHFDTSDNTSALLPFLLHEYGLPTTAIGPYYSLPLPWDVSREETATASSLFTNDPTRDIQMLPFEKAEKDIATYRCFYCEADRNALNYEGEDKEYLFIDGQWWFGVKKSLLPSYAPLQQFGIQAIEGLFGYSSGYLVLFPFKFPVDHQTFRAVQKKEQLLYGGDDTFLSLQELAGEWRRPKFQNADIMYDKYLWDDQDWVYLWSWTGGNTTRVLRIPKSSDFALSSL